jgi:NDP-sugar pyrophosphorylase family protein
MKAVILAAGKGTRLGDLTKDRPKPMMLLNKKPVLEYVLRSLPASITEVIMVIGYHGDTIKEHFGETFEGRMITYVQQGSMMGTAGALWSAKEALGNGTFLVIQGDDIHLSSELESCMTHPLAYGVQRVTEASEIALAIEVDDQGNLTGWHTPDATEVAGGISVTTGTYVLDQRIFTYEPVSRGQGEYGLPQTILAMSKDHPVAVVTMEHWLTVTYPHDIQTVEQSLIQSPWHSQ